MLSPECRQGERESDLLITTLINGDGDKPDTGGQGTLVQAGEGAMLSFASSCWKDNIGGGGQDLQGAFSFLFAFLTSDAAEL